MYETILVPLDGSRRAESVIPNVKALARLSSARVVLLRVVNPQSMLAVQAEPSPANHKEELRRQTDEAREYLEDIEIDLASEWLAATIRLSYGPVVDTIVTVAVEEEADLIAMTSHDRRRLSQATNGSTASGVLQRANRPVLIVRSRSDN